MKTKTGKKLFEDKKKMKSKKFFIIQSIIEDLIYINVQK